MSVGWRCETCNSTASFNPGMSPVSVRTCCKCRVPLVPNDPNLRFVSTIETITPAMAQGWLDAIPKDSGHLWQVASSRPARAKVQRFAVIMAAGDWKLVANHAVTFGPDGSILTGVLRCLACIEANVPFDSVVERFVARDAADGARC